MFPNDLMLLDVVKKTKYWKINNKKASSNALRAIRKMLSRMKTFWPRETGQGWDLPKFLEQLHVIDDIIWNSALAGSFSGPLENNFIPFVKKPSKRTQKKKLNWIIKLQTETMKLTS